jgi:Rhs family protein
MTNYDLSVRYFPSTGSEVRTLNRPEGSYSFQGSSRIPDADVEYSLNGSSTYYTVFTPDGRRREYYGTLNKLETVRNSSGTLLYTLNYSTKSTPASIAPVSGLLITVSNSFGQSLSLTYDNQSRLKTMTDPSGWLYQYSYDAQGNLSVVTYPDGKTRQYIYNEGTYTQGANLPTALTGIIDENNNRFAKLGYDASGMAIMTEHAGGAEHHEVSYASKPVVISEVVRDTANVPRYVRSYYSAPTGVALTDALGQVRQYSFTSLNGSVRATGSDKRSNGQCSAVPLGQAFDANGNVSSRTDFNGMTTTYAYDLSRNIETSRTEASGTPQARTITTQWHYSYRWPTEMKTYAGGTATGTPKLVTTLAYGTSGNVNMSTVTDPALGLSRTSTFTRNDYGQVLTANGPRTDVSDVTTTTYYACTTGFQCGHVNTTTQEIMIRAQAGMSRAIQSVFAMT